MEEERSIVKKMLWRCNFDYKKNAYFICIFDERSSKLIVSLVKAKGNCLVGAPNIPKTLTHTNTNELIWHMDVKV